VRIGLISQEYPPETAKGGIGTQTMLKAHGLAAMGNEVRVLSRSPDGRRSERQEGTVRIIRIESMPMPVYTELADWLAYSLCVAKELAEEHARQNFDILDFPEWGCEGYAHLLNQSEWNHVPSVVQLHGPLVMLGRTIGWPDPDSTFFRVGTQMEAASLQLADAVYSSSDCSADWCVSEYGMERSEIVRLHTGIDLELFRPMSIPKAERPTIVFVGKIVSNKGVELLVEAACSLVSEFSNLHLRLLGRGEAPLIEALRRKVAARGLSDMIEIPGPVAHEDLPEQLSRAHVFAAPSQYEGGPGFVYLEAMACGLPVIACSGSGASEVVIDGENGFLVPPDDVDGLTRALRYLLSDPKARETMGEIAQRYVRETASSDRCIAEIDRFYRHVIEECGSNKIKL
jgi:glycogen synthase